MASNDIPLQRKDFVGKIFGLMDQLKQLAHIVNRNKIKQIDLLDLQAGEGTKVNHFYQMLSAETVKTDEEAFGALFPGATSKSAYHNLKGNLRRKLLNTVFFIDAHRRGSTDRQTAFFELNKDFTAARFLLAKNALEAGIPEVEKVCKKAMEYEFVDLVLMSARILRMHYATKKGDHKLFAYYQENYRRYFELSHLEALAEEYYAELVVHYVRSKSRKEELKELAQRYYQALSSHYDTVDTYAFRLHTSLVRLFYFTCENDYVSTLSICDEVIAFFQEKPFDTNPAIQIALHHQLVAYMQLNDYEKAVATARRSQNLLESGSYNWFKNREYQLLLALKMERYQSAYHIFVDTKEQRNFKSLPDAVKEMWGIYRAYLHFLGIVGELDLDPKDKNFTSFRINRFLNSTPIYSKDKRGMNVAILVLQILFYIQQKKYDVAIERIDAIEKYCSRYLYQEDTIRAYHFIRLLLTIPKASFNPKLVVHYAKKRLKALKGIDKFSGNPFHKTEILSYEKLWEITLLLLEGRLETQR